MLVTFLDWDTSKTLACTKPVEFDKALLRLSSHIVRNALPILIGFALTLSSFAVHASQVEEPWIRIDQWHPDYKGDPEVVRGVVLPKLDLGQLTKSPSLVFILPGRKTRLLLERQEQPNKNATVWRGRLEDDPLSLAVFSVVDGVAFGTLFTSDSRIFRLVNKGGSYAIEEIDQSKFPPGKPPISIHSLAKQNFLIADEGFDDSCATQAATLNEMACATDAPGTIDVLVLYTPATRIAVGSTALIQAEIHTAAGIANASYLTSGITQQIRINGPIEVPYEEAELRFPGFGNTTHDLCNLHEPVPIYSSQSCRYPIPTNWYRPITQAATLRENHKADLVVLFVESSQGGIAYPMESVSPAFGDHAYAVVPRNAASLFFTFAHELGHNMGARHDWKNDTKDNSPYHFNHGYIRLTPSNASVKPWFTIMAERTTDLDTLPACKPLIPTDPSPCVRKQFWSNPDRTDHNDPTGQSTPSDPSDNRRTVNCTALTVANFRCSSPTPNNVWMKDAWNDTGVEPDSALASTPMWKSPYIWVRRQQDANRIHAHQHENPLFGQTNWAYVKVHNSGAQPTSGTLELYYADASTGLSWPTSWKKICWSVSGTITCAQPLTSFLGNSTKIVEFQWDNLPGSGHYCLVARWVSSVDPMTHSEGSSIEANVRLNNNIIWRNLNIINLGTSSTGTARLLVNNPEDKNITISLQIKLALGSDGVSFLKYGGVFLKLDKSLVSAWKLGNFEGEGFKLDDQKVRVTGVDGAMLDGLVLEPKSSGEIEILLTRSGQSDFPRRKFSLDVVQRKHEQGKVDIMGGVSYEIDTESAK